MVDRTRELEFALGGSIKKIEDNELETTVLQRRCIRASRELNQGEIISHDMIEVLRPATNGSITPIYTASLIGKKLNHTIKMGAHLQWKDIV